MNRAMMRMSKRIGKKMMSLPENEFEEISYSEIQRLSVKNKPFKAWKNNHHVVQLYPRNKYILGVMMDKWMIRRNDAEPIRDWYEIYNIKNKVIGENTEAIQVFPKKDELVDVANMYWLFTPTVDYE